MLPDDHRRYLSYLERYSYFKRPGTQKLSPEQWLALDAELARVLVLKSKEPEVLAQEAGLRAQLLRD